MADRNPWRDAPLSGDDLYGDRDNLRRYRDFARDEHRRFGAQAEHEREGGVPFRDRFSEYDDPQTDLTRGAYASPGQRHATEGGYAFGLGERPKPQRPNAQNQSHRGRGPRGYQRADRRIYEDICERFTDDEHIDASEIEIQVKEGEVTLSGKLRSRNSKRWAGDLAEQVSGVKDVHNLIRVVDEQVWPPRRVARE